jgi:hypothetical protein
MRAELARTEADQAATREKENLLDAAPRGGVGEPAAKDLKDVNPADVGVEFVKPEKDPRTGFVVGGRNETTLIRKLTKLNGRTIAELEADMRPGAMTEVGSEKGFLGPKESLLAVLAADNDYVLGDLKLTHQELARRLRLMAAHGLKVLTDSGKLGLERKASFTYHGRRFTIEYEFTKGDQLSPFKDGTKTGAYADLVIADTGKKLGFSLLVPDMIERYGFYEGTGTPYRVDPKAIVAVLDFLKK